jgi:hypothetical protein
LACRGRSNVDDLLNVCRSANEPGAVDGFVALKRCVGRLVVQAVADDGAFSRVVAHAVESVDHATGPGFRGQEN